MATLSEIRERVLRVLADPGAAQYDNDLLDDGIKAALEAILPWVFKRSLATLTADSTTVSFELPDDLYRVVAVLDSENGLYIPQNILSPGRPQGSDLDTNQDWMEYPDGWISFAVAPEYNIVVHYGATWEVPADESSIIESPSWTHRALVYYAASYALLNRASSSASIRQWNVETDSGTPAMNPMKDMSTYYFERFRIEMERMPAMARGNYA